MAVNSGKDQAFLHRLTEITKANLNNEQFGVNDLAREMVMSRSSLHRHLKNSINLTVSQFIGRVRLEKAMEILRESSDSVSEVAYNVGFSSPAYFSHCFHKYYGYPPGEVKNRLATEINEELPTTQANTPLECKPEKTKYKQVFLWGFVVLLVVAGFVFVYQFFVNDSLFQAKNKDLSIIVLPFRNLSENSANAFFADGIQEDILNDLYWITDLRVVSRTSAEQFRESTLSAREIAKKMNVRYVLEGSYRGNEEKVRISVQLIDAGKQEGHLWSANIDRELGDIIGIQDEIALQVASRLKTVLSENERQKIEKISTQNPKAYAYYLQARFLHHKTTSELRSGFDKSGVVNCIKYYEMAIAEDENFADAYAGLANAWLNLSAWGFLGTHEGFLKGRDLSKKALEIDPECAEAHAVLGTYLVWAERNFKEGEEELKTAVNLNPNFATARQWYAQYLMITGPIEEARRQVNYAINLEPNFWVVQTLNSWIYYFEKTYNNALEACTLARDFNPYFSSNEWLFVLNYAKLGESEKMKEQLKKIAEHYTGTDDYASGIDQAYNKAGIDGLFQWMIDVNKNNPIKVEGLNGHPFYIAWWYAILGNKEEAVYWLEKVMEEKRIPYHYFNLICTNPDFEALHDDPRFLKIVEHIGLAPYYNKNRM